MTNINGLETYYHPIKTVDDCWNDTILISESEINGLSHDEVVIKLSNFFFSNLKMYNLTTNKEWATNYVLDHIQACN